jgi:hypothetical protein
MKKDLPTHWVMDYETLVNCFVGVFQHYKDDSISEIFVINQDQNDLPKFIEFLNKCVQLNQWHISYNGLAFDAQISQHIIKNQRKLLSLTGLEVAQYIHKLAQDIITRSDRGEFQEFAPRQLKIRQIDLFKMNHWDNKAKMSSLKWIQYSMDWMNVEEMPHHHTAPVENAEQLQDVIQYCINDVLSTKKILEHSKEQIELRKTLTNEYGIDLYSASEPRISKELFLFFLEQKLGWDKAEIKRLRTKRDEIYLGQCILPYVKFQTPEFQKIHDYFRTKVVTSTKDKLKYTLDYKGVKTDYGLGGIHGAKDSGVYEAHPGWTILTSDVTSFYPNLAIKNKFHPAHLPQKEFGDLYEWFFEERKKIPKTDPKNYVYKIILNSTYGLTGDENSFLYDPQMTMQITINGQLLLSMLYEMLCLEIPEGIPLMQNTDGLEMMIPTSAVSKYMEVCDKWCLLTQLQLEHDEYSKMVIADVNNYIAVYKNGKVKCKGKFEWEDLEKKKVAMLHKNKSFLIIPKAIYAYFVNGIPPEEFLAQNKSFYDYCAGVKAKGGWYYEERSLVKGQLVTNKLQKIVRYYITKSGNKILKRHPDGREMQVEAGQWMQKTANEIDPNIPYEAYDIDTEYYLENIYKQIEQINKVSHASFTQLSLF